jgi:hypothetical protein
MPPIKDYVIFMLLHFTKEKEVPLDPLRHAFYRDRHGPSRYSHLTAIIGLSGLTRVFHPTSAATSVLPLITPKQPSTL